MVCELGYLYNKDAVLSALLDRTLDPTFEHLRGLKDLMAPKVSHHLYMYMQSVDPRRAIIHMQRPFMSQLICVVSVLTTTGVAIVKID